MGTADTRVSISSMTNRGQDFTIPLSSDNLARSSSSHHVFSDETSPSPMVPSDKLESNSDIVKAELSFYSTPHIRDYEALFAACSS